MENTERTVEEKVRRIAVGVDSHELESRRSGEPRRDDRDTLRDGTFDSWKVSLELALPMMAEISVFMSHAPIQPLAGVSAMRHSHMRERCSCSSCSSSSTTSLIPVKVRTITDRDRNETVLGLTSLWQQRW